MPPQQRIGPDVRTYLVVAGAVALGLIASLAARAVLAQAQTEDDISITGVASAVDGDTVEISGRRVRVYGIEAPERGEPGFEEATEFMRGMAESGPFVCGIIDKDGDDGEIAICVFVSKGAPDYVAKKLLQRGLVRTYPKHRDLAPDQFAVQETYEARAKRQCEGLWQELPECQ